MKNNFPPDHRLTRLIEYYERLRTKHGKDRMDKASKLASTTPLSLEKWLEMDEDLFNISVKNKLK